LDSHPEYIQILQQIAAKMFRSPITAYQVLKTARLYPNHLEFWLPMEAKDTLWLWPPYYIEWVHFWMSKPNLPLPETISALQDAKTDDIIFSFDSNATESGNWL
jgi:hypothetical protein